MMYDINFLTRVLKDNPYSYYNWYIILDKIYKDESKSITREDILLTFITVANIATELSLKSAIFYLKKIYGANKDDSLVQLKNIGHNLEKLIDQFEHTAKELGLNELLIDDNNENILPLIKTKLSVLKDLNFVNIRYPLEKDLDNLSKHLDKLNYIQQLNLIKESADSVRDLRGWLEYRLNS